MSSNTGTATFTTGTGTKSIVVGILPTWCEVEFGGSNILHSHGFIYGTSQFVYPDPNSSITNGKVIQVKDTTGTVILEGTWTGFSGTQINFNITTAPTTMPQMLLTFGN